MSDTFSLILGAVLVAAAVVISVFLYLTSRRSRSAPVSVQEQAELDARRHFEAAQAANIRHTGRGAGL